VGFIGHQKFRFKKHLECGEKLKAAEILLLPKSEYKSLKKGKEIYFGDSKYDLLEVKDNGTHWQVLAINDKLEKLMEEGLVRDNSEKKTKGKTTMKLTYPDWISSILALNNIISYSSLVPLAEVICAEQCGFGIALFRPPRVSQFIY
jgi:hypothetical protein